MSKALVDTANSYLVCYVLLTVVAPALFAVWWYRDILLRTVLAVVDAVGLLGKRYAKAMADLWRILNND